MSTSRIRLIAHHARNRLASLLSSPTVARDSDLTDALLAISGDFQTIQTLCRLEGQAPIQPMEVLLNAFWCDLVAEVRRLAPSSLALVAEDDFSAAIFPYWTFDAPMVRMVLLDALSNAWRYGKHHVWLRAWLEADQLHFSIRDDGPGFPPERLDGEYRPVPSPDGHGEGLMLAKQVAEGHVFQGARGTVRLSNTPGACFVLSLP